MKIELQIPYKNRWKFGYLVTNKENRRTVILFNNKKDRSSVSYARYLMACNLQRYLAVDEHVDHIDNNKTNDILSNLQILTLQENNKKASKGKTYYTFICPVCLKEFKLEARQSHKKQPCCSRKCGGIKSHWK